MLKNNYNSPKKKNRRTLNTKGALRRLFGSHKRRPCYYCGCVLTIENATFDHRQALSRGGYDKTKNGVIACSPCNSAKGRLSVEVFKNKNQN